MLTLRRFPRGRMHSAEHLGEVLSGSRGHKGLRQVVVHPERHGVAEFLGQPQRTKYKPGRALTAYYRASPDGGRPGGVDVAVTWSGDGTVRVLVSPEDPAMPQLGQLTQVGHVARRVAELTGGRVRPAPGPAVETVRYRPGQRHVLLARFGDSVGSVYVKTDRDHSGARAVPVAGLVADVLAEGESGARAAEPVGYVEDDAAALWWARPGRSLARLLLVRPEDGPPAVERVGRALRALHDSPVPVGHPVVDGLPVHDARSETATVRRTGAHIEALLPNAAALYAELLRRAVERLDELPSEPATLVHGDVKAENLLIDRGQVWLLDFDRSCRADPALDLGKLLADLAWSCPIRREGAELERALRHGYGPCEPGRWARARQWEILFRLRIAARRCGVHEADWPSRVRGQVAAAALRMSRTE